MDEKELVDRIKQWALDAPTDYGESYRSGYRRALRTVLSFIDPTWSGLTPISGLGMMQDWAERHKTDG